MMQEENHIFQGLKRDNHQIKQDANFLWDAHNIRLTNRDDSTLLTITNEKGTSDPLTSIDGVYVGHCVLNQYLVVFTAKDDGSKCSIYRIEKKGEDYNIKLLFCKDDVWEFGWDPSAPIETLGVYENDLVQKVYWIDGKNSPRVINIVADKEYDETSFDFIQTLNLEEEVRVNKIYGEGMLAPGVIQYAFTYYNKYGQESNIFYVTPLQYISHKDRGGDPQEKLLNSFRIQLSLLDTRFDYVRIYSIHRTSIDATPLVKRLTDIPVNSSEVTYIDTGTTGETVDPTMLLYIGGKDIVASTICAKDGTLFLGNIELKEGEEWNDIKNEVKSGIIPSDCWEETIIRTIEKEDCEGEYYKYSPAIDNVGFKSGETYRCGIQFQYKTGAWSEPIFIEDKVLNNFHPESKGEPKPLWYSHNLNLDSATSTYLLSKGYRKARACVVFPTINDRTVLCQGVLCPTVYSVGARTNNTPYAMSSWFFRPERALWFSEDNPSQEITGNDKNIYKGASIQFRHNRALYTGADRGAEIQCSPSFYPITIDGLADENGNVDTDYASSYFFTDTNLVTMHSPDIEFDTNLQNLSLEDNLELEIVGRVELDAIIGDIDIQTSTGSIRGDAPGFNHKMLGFTASNYAGKKTDNINGGLVSGLFYEDSFVKDDSGDTENPGYKPNGNGFVNNMIYTWHRSGSLNNDTSRTNRSAKLLKKKISNLKYFNTFNPITPYENYGDKTADINRTYNIGKPELFNNSDEVSLIKVWVDYLQKYVPYYGNVNTAVMSNSDGYPLYYSPSENRFGGLVQPIPSGEGRITKATEGVRLTYKSSPHLVFSLKSHITNGIEILPGMKDNALNGKKYKIPDWQSGSVIAETPNYPELVRIGGAYDDYYSNMLHPIQDNELGKYGLIGNGVGSYMVVKAVGFKGGYKYWDRRSCIPAVANGTIFKVKGDGSCLVKGDKLIDTGTPDEFTKYVNEDQTNIYFKVITTSINQYERRVLLQSTTPIDSSKTEGSSPSFTYTQRYDSTRDNYAPFLLMAELRRSIVTNRFGGTSDEAIRSNLWLPAGDSVHLRKEGTTVRYEYGDTWYSRYDCLKTYPFTNEDLNSVIEIGSFKCETRVNIDGRYDRNRGQLSNLNMSPQNFNLLNEVYSQKDNFFNYRILEESYYKTSAYRNQVTWTKEKLPASDTDTWTNITLANVLDLDGSKGKVTALKVFNDTILCFQDKAISQIMFNSRVQIPVSDGVPVEISNGHKVDGSRLIDGTIGCQNKWSIITTPLGVYFIDSYTNTLWNFNGQIANISNTLGMKWWFQNNHSTKEWVPKSTESVYNGIRAFYDSVYNDIYFSPGPDDASRDALCYSEQLNHFVSQMSYGGVQAMFNFENGFYSLLSGGNTTCLYQNNVGDYNDFYGNIKGWDFSFISNQNPTITKIFDTLELRADIYDKQGELLNKCPFNFIALENEYQRSGDVKLDSKNMRKKFRIWRGLLPRNKGTRERFRNTWTKITLRWNPKNLKSNDTNSEDRCKTRVHDVSVKYTI